MNKNSKKQSRALVWYYANLARAKEAHKKWKQENQEHCRGYNQEWRKNNPDKVKLWEKRWRNKNPDKLRKNNRNFRIARQSRLNEIKLATGCKDCGFNKHPAALHFDHIRGKKSFVISTHCRYSWRALLKEILKCEIRCANCHAIRHAKT